MTTGTGATSCEIVSPVLQGRAEGIRPDRRGDARRSRPRGTGSTRVAGFTSTLGGSGIGDSEALARLVTITAYVEKGLYAITGSKARERGINGHSLRQRGFGSLRERQEREGPDLDRDRYHALNLTNLARGTKDTVEFRVFSGNHSAPPRSWSAGFRFAWGWSSGP